MKLLRYGQPGAEKPGLSMLTAISAICRSMRRISPAKRAPLAAIDKLRKLDPATLTIVEGNPRIARASPRRRTSMPSGSTMQSTRPKAACRRQPSRCCSPRRRHRFVARTIRLSSRKTPPSSTMRSNLASSSCGRRICLESRCAVGRCGLLRHQRRVRAQFPARTAGSMGEGQVRAELRPNRAVDRHHRRDPRSASARLLAGGQRPDAPALEHVRHDLRRRRDRQLHVALHAPGARRLGRHRHAGGRRARHEASVWLKPGDEVRLGIDGLGEQRQRVVAYPG